MNEQTPFVLVATGLAFEARIARRDSSARVCCGRGPEMESALSAAVEPYCNGILSFGIAGGLDPRLQTGTQLVASSVVTESGSVPTDANWSRSLLRSHPRAIHAPILSLNDAVVDPAGKEKHFRQSGAAAVDMESHIAARIAAKYSLPLAVLRVVADPASRCVPETAVAGLRPDGGTDILAVLRSLLRRPAEITDLIHVARDTWTARLMLLKSPRLFGYAFDLPEAAPLLPLSPATT